MGHTIKHKKIEANIAASKAAGAATKAAKEKAAGEQKETALKSGGRFQEGDTITTVVKGGTKNAQGGTDFRVKLSDSPAI